MYFKLLQRRIGEKDPSAEALALCVGVIIFPKVLLSLCAGTVEAPLFSFYIKSALFVTGFIGFGNIFSKNVHTPFKRS